MFEVTLLVLVSYLRQVYIPNPGIFASCDDDGDDRDVTGRPGGFHLGPLHLILTYGKLPHTARAFTKLRTYAYL